jgi:hypothetical protein
VVSYYPVFIDMLRHLLDPDFHLTEDFWERQKSKRDNTSVKSTSEIIKILKTQDSAFMQKLNVSLSEEWRIYDAGFRVFEAQARHRGLLRSSSGP